MTRLPLVAALALFTATLYASEGPSAPQPGKAQPLSIATVIATCPQAPATMSLRSARSMIGAPVAPGDCASCGNVCEPKTKACQNGSVKACYEAAACLCECNLNAGGCGSSKDALEECIRENRKLAERMK